MLLAQKSYVEGALALVLYCGRLHDDAETLDDAEARERARLLLELLTPIAKSWPSQWCLEANSLAIQVHGGYGYSSEYDVEQHYRDNRLNAIHEGTHGIQALDLLGRKTVMADGAALQLLVDAVTSTVRRAHQLGGEAAILGERLRVALDDVCDVTHILHGADDAAALANATIYLEATGHVVVAWLWLEQFLAALDGDEPFHEGKRQAARFFFRHELPRTSSQFDWLRRVDRTVLDTAPEVF